MEFLLGRRRVRGEGRDSMLATDTETMQEAPWRSGLRSAQANLRPGLVLQVAALALVIAYYQHEPTRAALNRLALWRAEAGVAFAMTTTGIFGGLLPFLYLRSQSATRHQYNWAQGASITAFWAYKGFEVDFWYRLLARFVGGGHEAKTIAIKSLLDQFIYCPLFAVPITALIYFWTETRFDGAATAADVSAGGWYRRRVLPVLISNFGVWLPAVGVIYALPTPLQLPLQNLVLCFFTLLVSHQTRRRR